MKLLSATETQLVQGGSVLGVICYGTIGFCVGGVAGFFMGNIAGNSRILSLV